MSPPHICAVIPAAGRGSRLGLDVPKVFAPLADGWTVWDVLSRRIAPHVTHIHLILPPLVTPPPSVTSAPGVSFSVQPVPLGMGDAIFGAYPAWKEFPHILVVWGDQLGVSEQTLAEASLRQQQARGPRITLPLVEATDLYVEYVLDPRGERLVRVLSTRDGDTCAERGLSDVGVFGLSTSGLWDAWARYLEQTGGNRGSHAGEVHFLPFLAHLSSEREWPIERVIVTAQAERRGVNTPADLAFFRERFRDSAM